VNFTPSQAMKAKRCWRHSSTLSLTSTLYMGGSSTPRPGRFNPGGKDPVQIVQEAGWAPKPVWTEAENLSPAGFGSANRKARSESLYRLSCPGDLLWSQVLPMLTDPTVFSNSQTGNCCRNLLFLL